MIAIIFHRCSETTPIKLLCLNPSLSLYQPPIRPTWAPRNLSLSLAPSLYLINIFNLLSFLPDDPPSRPCLVRCSSCLYVTLITPHNNSCSSSTTRRARTPINCYDKEGLPGTPVVDENRRCGAGVPRGARVFISEKRSNQVLDNFRHTYMPCFRGYQEISRLLPGVF